MKTLNEWRRPEGDSKFHAISAVVFGGSMTTRCRGRWPSGHETEQADDPPDADRCCACVRDLARYAFDLGDLGGES